MKPCHQRLSALKTPFIVALIAALIASPARATDFSWATPADGVYTNPFAWTPIDILGGVFGPPGPGDTANFNLGATDATRYIVSGVAGQSDRLLIGNDALELNIASGATYELLSTSSTDADIVVGRSNGQTGDLLLTGGGTLKGIGFVGDASGSTGTVTVTGTGSRWDTGEIIVVGVGGNGSLNIENGGVVSSLSFSQIASDSGSTGTVTVAGAGSRWNPSFITVGFDGNGSLNIEDSGVVSSRDGFVGRRFSSTSTATVTGTGSSWTSSGNFYVGGSITDPLLSDGSGTLNILDDGAMSVAGLTKIWGPGTVNLNGGTFSTGSLQILGAFNFDQGTLNLTSSNLSIGPGVGIPGFSDSTLSLQPGMAVNVTRGTGNIVAGGVLLVNGSTASFSAAGGTNDGDIIVIDGSIAYTGPISNNALAKISTIGATLTFAGDGLPTSSGGNNADGLTNLGTLNLTNTVVNGDVHSPAGSTVNGAGAVVFNGLVSGGANISGNTTTFNGGYSPGDSPAEVSISGDVTLGSTNTLFLELAGTTLGAEYDHLDIGGLLTADGALDIQLLNSFAPQLGDTFDLLDFGSLAGSFSNIFLPALSEGLIFDTTSLLADGMISVVEGLLGDFDFDGDVDGADFLLWQRGGSPNVLSPSDLAVWQNNYGTNLNELAAAATVPEPSSLVLLAMGLLGLGQMRSVFLRKTLDQLI